MKHEPHDHAPIVESWLKEPVWLPPSDTARLTQLIHQTPQQRRWWQRYLTESPHVMFSATKFVLAGVILLVFGGFLASAYLPSQGQVESVPAAETSPPTVLATEPATEAPSAEPVTEAPTTTPAVAVEGALVMEPGTGETVGGFTQVGRLSTQATPRYGELLDLQAVGDRLVVHSTVSGDKEGTGEVILYSTDALTWSPASLPGKEPEILDLVTTADGLMASGSVLVDGERAARLWASPDGVEWKVVPSPAGRRVHQIISTDAGAMAVRSGEQIWVSDDGSEWTKWGKVGGMSLLQGPNGILSWQGGGQDRGVPTVVVQQATLLSPVSEVILPPSLRWDVASLNEPHMGIEVFALDDTWVMVGSEHRAPDSISVSADGLDWQDVPRPPEMSEGAVRWLARVGDHVQAFGTVAREDGNPAAIWTWQLGEEAAEPETLQGTGDEWIDTPVAWRDGYVATGYERNREQFLTVWRMEAVPAD